MWRFQLSVVQPFCNHLEVNPVLFLRARAAYHARCPISRDLEGGGRNGLIRMFRSRITQVCWLLSGQSIDEDPNAVDFLKVSSQTVKQA